MSPILRNVKVIRRLLSEQFNAIRSQSGSNIHVLPDLPGAPLLTAAISQQHTGVRNTDRNSPCYLPDFPFHQVCLVHYEYELSVLTIYIGPY